MSATGSRGVPTAASALGTGPAAAGAASAAQGAAGAGMAGRRAPGENRWQLVRCFWTVPPPQPGRPFKFTEKD